MLWKTIVAFCFVGGYSAHTLRCVGLHEEARRLRRRPVRGATCLPGANAGPIVAREEPCAHMAGWPGSIHQLGSRLARHESEEEEGEDEHDLQRSEQEKQKSDKQVQMG